METIYMENNIRKSPIERKGSQQQQRNSNFITDYCLTVNNSSSHLSINSIVPKNAVDLTTARFRMLANAEDFARPFEAKVDNNLSPERYSNIDLVIHFSEIAHSGLSDEILRSLIQGRRMLRRLYFNSNYCLYFEKLTNNSPLIMYRLNTNPKPGIWIDQIVRWYPLFPNEPDQCTNNDQLKKSLILQEKLIFMQHLKLEFREILLEYYELTDVFPHRWIMQLIAWVEDFIRHLVDRSLKPFESINEVCKKCGESFANKTDLINHHDFNACRLAPVHRCQCGQIYLTHREWQSHCISVHMDCPSFAWHIWRQKRSSKSYSFICDGCQHVFYGFLKFYHHCCFCPFFFAFFIANCPFCTPQTRLEFYQTPEVQQIISSPHADRVGMSVIKEWANITQIKFNIKLAVNEEPLFNL